MEKKTNLIQHISNKTLTNKWINGKAGQFMDFENDCQYRFLETDENCYFHLIEEKEQRTLHVVATGYVGYLIKHWGNDIQKINENYLNIRLNEYRNLNKNNSDADLRNLENEFYSNYKTWESEWVKQSEAIFEFITDDEIKMIKGYIDRYFRYVDTITINNSKKQGNINHTQLTINGNRLKSMQDKKLIEEAAAQHLNWIATLKELNYFVNKHYTKEPNKWEKTINTFFWNNEKINKNSLLTAIDKYDNPPKSAETIDKL